MERPQGSLGVPGDRPELGMVREEADSDPGPTHPGHSGDTMISPIACGLPGPGNIRLVPSSSGGELHPPMIDKQGVSSRV